MRKSLLLLTFCSITINTIFAAKINGTIKDITTKEPIGYVNISIKDKNNNLITGGTSNDNGQFSISTEKGDFVIDFSFIGYKNHQKKISVKTSNDNGNINLGTIWLEEDAQMLGEVEVIGQGMQMRLEIDKKVFSVDQNLSAAGASVSEVLQNIPSVDIDGEGNVSLRNNSNVEVWINGKPAGLTEENRGQILEQMPAGSIESVELITNPSAKHNPEGTAGVINLVMKKKTTKTYYGSVSAGIQWPTASKIPGGNLGASFNYNSPKVDVYANLGVNYHNRVSGNSTNRYSLLNATDTISLLNSSSQSQNNRLGFFGRAGIDIHITERNTLSLSGFGMYNKGNNATDINYTSYDYQTSPISLLRNYSRDNNGKNTFPVYNARLEYRHDFLKKGSFISADISVGNHGNSRTTDYIQKDIISSDTIISGNETQESSNKNLRIEGNIDFTYKFTDKRRLEAGWESNFSQRQNIASAFNNLTDKEIDAFYNNFNYQEQIHSLYATYGDMYGNFSMQLGLRGEYMKVNTTTISKTETINNQREYWQLYPSAFFAYSFKNNHELQINYTRRVNRPRGRQINPYRDFSDSTSISFGNPDLNPQFSSSVELNYLKTWDFHSISASAYYKYADNVIQRISYRNGNIMENTFINISRQQSAGIEFVAKNQLWKRLNLTTSINLYYEKLDSANTTINDNIIKIKGQENFSWNARLMANVMITKTTTAQITANYRAPRIIAQGRQNHNYSLDIGIRQTFLKGKLNLNLTARDILDSRKFRSETWGETFYQKSEGYWSGRTIGLTISYNFGNLRDMKKTPNANMNDSQSGDDFFIEE